MSEAAMDEVTRLCGERRSGSVVYLTAGEIAAAKATMPFRLRYGPHMKGPLLLYGLYIIEVPDEMVDGT